jgi:lipopolysaccharide/colanic/teichoic acid biosynthesis glycosyltransferase
MKDFVRPIAVYSEVRPLASNGVPPVEHRTALEWLDRSLNITISVLGLAITFPIVMIFAALIKLTSPGPVFYTQARIGLNRRGDRGSSSRYDRRSRDLGGRPFMILKLRTMQQHAERAKGAVWAARGDARVTKIGRIMRAYRIDEIPQLINVIKGEMNIVGPRPERPSIFSRLCDDIDEYPLRQAAKPGITGWAQVNRSYDTSLDDVRDKVRYDLEYLNRRGIGADIMIMARTLPVMLFRRGGW